MKFNLVSILAALIALSHMAPAMAKDFGAVVALQGDVRLDQGKTVIDISRCTYSHDGMSCVPIAERDYFKWKKNARAQKYTGYEVVGGDAAFVGGVAVSGGVLGYLGLGAGGEGIVLGSGVASVGGVGGGALVKMADLFNRANPDTYFNRAAVATNLYKSQTVIDTPANERALQADLASSAN